MKSDDIILITGKIRSGKSTYLKKHIEKLQKAKVPFIIWDYNYEHEVKRGKIAYRLEDVLSYFPTYPYIVYRPQTKDFQTFDLFCEVCLKYFNFVVIIEEIDRFATPYIIPPHFKQMIDTGSHHQSIGIICTTRRIMKLNADIPFNSSYIVVFKQNRPQDLRYLSDFVGEGVLGITKLPDYHYMIWSSENGQLIAHNPALDTAIF